MSVSINGNSLVIDLSEVHPLATMSMDFQRTLRIPDDNQIYPLPPGFGSFPLRSIEDFPNAPSKFKEHGGFMFPMYQSEAMWISFHGSYPIALKIAAGSINAIDGNIIESGLNCHGEQDYVAIPGQPWLDGFCVSKGNIRQFVAMPLGSGLTVEEQLTGQAHFGGLQIIAYALKAAKWEMAQISALRSRSVFYASASCSALDTEMDACMGFGAGGMMHQEISSDTYLVDDYDLEHPVVCHVNLCNSEQWHMMTNEPPPYKAPSPQDYTRAGLPWFDHYMDGNVIEGSEILAGVKSVNQILAEEGGEILSNNESIQPGISIINL